MKCAATALAGCNIAFGLDEAHPPVHDAALHDTPLAIDALCGGHDEDADGLPDGCDPCPAYSLMAANAFAGVEMMAGGSTIICVVSRPSGTELISLIVDGSMQGSTMPISGIGPIRFVLVHRADGRFDCKASRDGGVVAFSGGNATGTTSAIGLVALETTLSASSVAVFTR